VTFKTRTATVDVFLAYVQSVRYLSADVPRAYLLTGRFSITVSVTVNPLSPQNSYGHSTNITYPIITYVCPARASNILNTSWSTIETFQSATLRQITNLPYYVSRLNIRKTTNTTSPSDFIESTTFKWKTEISNQNFPYIKNISKKHDTSYGHKINRPIKF